MMQLSGSSQALVRPSLYRHICIVEDLMLACSQASIWVRSPIGTIERRGAVRTGSLSTPYGPTARWITPWGICSDKLTRFRKWSTPAWNSVSLENLDIHGRRRDGVNIPFSSDRCIDVCAALCPGPLAVPHLVAKQYRMKQSFAASRL